MGSRERTAILFELCPFLQVSPKSVWETFRGLVLLFYKIENIRDVEILSKQDDPGRGHRMVHNNKQEIRTVSLRLHIVFGYTYQSYLYEQFVSKLKLELDKGSDLWQRSLHYRSHFERVRCIFPALVRFFFY